MTTWQIVLPWIVPLAVLLLAGGLMSGSEAALFSLRRRDLKQMRAGKGGGRIAARLLDDPERLLSGILFWNLLVNMTYFAMVGIIGARLERSPAGTGVAVTFTLTTLLTVIFFSEMLPKSLAVLAPRRFAALCAFPLAMALRLLRPVLPVIRIANLAALRLFWPRFQAEPEIDLDAIGRAIDLGIGDTELARREHAALKSLVQLADLKSGACMRPRSTLALCRPPVTPQAISRAFSRLAGERPPSGYLMIIEAGGDHIVGSLDVDSLRPSQLGRPGAMIQPVCYVPWSSSVSAVLDSLLARRLNVAVVVNEFGDTIGILTIEDIVQQILTERFDYQLAVESP